MKNISLPNLDIGMVRETARKWLPQFIGVGLLVMLFLGIWGALASATTTAQAEVRELQEQRAAVEREVAALQEYADMEAKAVSAEKLVQQAMGTNPAWSALLADISSQLPNGVWLTEITATYKSAPAGQSGDQAAGSGEILLRGWGTDHMRVADWVEEAKALPGLSDVRYQFTTEDTLDNMPVVRFEVKAALLPGEPDQPVGEGVQ